MVLHVRRERGRRAVAPVAHRTLERFLIVVRFHVNLQVIATIRKIVSCEFVSNRRYHVAQ